ncbi:hypothetical protein H0H87_007053 [Tephrocybe sp. NHM501043]|nr:hypothetical protein H0H87_007053 [Tephrocybe sp. NHM501043]
MWNPLKPSPAPPGFGTGKVLPEENASILSRVTFQWLDAFLNVGYTRPLEENDLWELPDKRLAENITNDLELAYYSRCPPEDRPKSFRDTKVDSDASKAGVHDFKSDEKAPVKAESDPEQATSGITTMKDPVYDSSVFKALHAAFFKRIWIAGALHLCSDVLKTTTPLLNKVILTWLTNSYVYHRLSDEEKTLGILEQPRGIGYGIGLAFALFVMQGKSSFE